MITAGGLYAYTGGQQSAPYEDAYLKFGEGMVSFFSHPIDSTAQGISNWQESIAVSALKGDGLEPENRLAERRSMGSFLGTR